MKGKRNKFIIVLGFLLLLTLYLTGDAYAACVYNYPSVHFTPTEGVIVGVSSTKVYTVTITNNDTAECAASTFTLSISSETGDVASFVPPSILGSLSTGALNPGQRYNTTLTVTTAGSITEGHRLTSIVQAVDNTNHSGKTGKGSVVTKASAYKGTGMILRRAEEEICHSCHKTDRNRTPMDSDWNQAIKTHSSVSLGSSKWSAEGGWGVAGGKYGEFVCTTCHTAHDTMNIYLIKEVITTPDGSNWASSGEPRTPASAVGNLDFRKKSGAVGEAGLMGDDTGGHATSTRVCEVCHSQTSYHKYNQPTDPGHSNAQDCTGCHSHKIAFGGAGACNACHGAPPGSGTDNNLPAPYTTMHTAKHYDPAAGVPTSYTDATNQSTATYYAFGCGRCHSTNSADHGTSETNGIVNVNLRTGETFTRGIVATANTPPPGSVTFYNYNSTCSSVYCHGNFAGSGITTNIPTWGNSASGACGTCHGATAASPPSGGSHNKHVNSSYYSFGCQLCHNTTTTTGNTITDKSIHVNEASNWAFSTSDSRTNGGTYNSLSSGSKSPPSTTYYSCNNLYCHSNAKIGTGVGAYTTPTWGGVSLTCSGCHGNPPSYANGGAGTATANTHGKHVTDNNYACSKCHNNTTNPDNTIKYAGGKHVNGSNVGGNASADVVFSDTGSYSYQTAPVKTCSSTYCHGGSTPQWGGASLACNGCHGANNAMPGRHGTHYNSATVVTSNSAGRTSSASGYIYQCGDCHDPAGTQHAKGPVSADQYAQMSFNSSYAGTGTSYTAGAYAGSDNGFRFTAGTCGTYCHSPGTGTAGPFTPNNTSFNWNSPSGTLDCKGCHKYTSASADPMATNNHSAHINNAGVIGTNYTCGTCHSTTASGNDIGTYDNHTNVLINIGFSDAFNAGAFYAGVAAPMTKTPGTAPGSCTSLYCHSDGRRDTTTRLYLTPTWGGPGIGCNGCHGTSNIGAPDYANGGPGAATANSHSAHVTDGAGAYQPSRCTWCHNNTTTNGTSVSTPPHLNNTIDVNISATYGGTYSVAGPPAKNCSSVACHGTGTDAVAPQWGSDATCINCHQATTLGNLRRVVKGTGATVTGDFIRPSRHVSDGTTTEIVTNFDCIVCHMEGDPTSTSTDVKIDKNYHPLEPVATNTINLRNVDNYTTGWAIDKTAWTTAMRNDMDRFCLSCHDSDTSADTNVTITASGSGAQSWTATGGTTSYLNLFTNDGDNNYYRTNTNNTYHTNAMHDMSSSVTGTIDSVTAYGVCRGEATGNKMRLALRIGTTNYDGATEHTLTTSYATYSQTWTTNPAGGSWTWTAINGMEAGFKSTTIATAQRCTQMYVVVAASGTNFDIGTGTKLVWGPNLGGASTIAVNATNNGLLTGTAVARRFTPFNTNDNQQNAKEVDTEIRTARANSGVKDIRGQFNSQSLVGKGWASHHNLNIFEKRYSARNTTAWPNGAWTTWTTREGQVIRTAGEAAGLHCSDCHLNESNAHGSANTYYMLSNNAGNDTAFTNIGSTTDTGICSKCHTNTVYGDGSGDTTTSRTDAHNNCTRIGYADNRGLASLGSDSQIGDKLGTTHLTCLGCHGGRNFGEIHGTNTAFRPGSGNNAYVPPYRFIGTGGSMRFGSPDAANNPVDGDWELATGSFGCYTISAVDTFGGCTQHGGFQSTPINRSRLLQY